MQDELYHQPDDNSGGSVALFLALYLLVLAFFILLVSISTVEEVKKQAAMESLSKTFNTLAVRETKSQIIAGQKFQEQITNIFLSAIQVLSIDVVEPGRLMRVQIDSDILFESGEVKIRESIHTLLDRIVASLSARPPGFRYDMEFINGSSNRDLGSMSVGQTLEMSRAGTFVRSMLSRGVPPDSVAVGIKPGDPRITNIWFYVRSIDETRLKFNWPVEGKVK